MEELRQQQLLERRQLPKKLKAEHKQQVAELRKAIRQKKVENDKEKFRQVSWWYYYLTVLPTCMCTILTCCGATLLKIMLLVV